MKLLGAEYLIALGVASWSALKIGYLPWPPTLVKTSIAFVLLGLVAMADEGVAATLGGAFLLAQLLKMYQSGTPYTGGIPTVNTPELPYSPLKFGGK